MNPFTESTVAQPLSGNHPDRRWTLPSHAETPSQHVDMATPVVHDVNVNERPISTGLKGVDQDVKNTEAPIKRVARVREPSSRFALAIGLCLSLSSLSGLVYKPVVLTAGLGVAGILMPTQSKALDLNTATMQDLQSLNGIGPKTAAMIVDERTRGGKFSSLSDLSDRVRGIGPKRAAALQAAGLTVGPDGGGEGKTKPPQASKKGK